MISHIVIVLLSILVAPVCQDRIDNPARLFPAVKLESRQKEQKGVDKKLSIEKARRALLKLLETDLQKELEKLTIADDAKRNIAHIASNDNKKELQSGKVRRFDHMKGIAFIGDWGLVEDDSTFNAVVESERQVIWVKGVFVVTGEEYSAVIKEIATGYVK
jgi:hypothetical protein